MTDDHTTIDGRYRVLSRIGSGGMADVYLAEDLQLGRRVALKVLHHRFAEDAEFVERFRREASAAAGLAHPNVVSVFDRGEWNGTSYIAMEYLPGRSLKMIVRQHGALDPVVAIDVVIQILRASRFAHQRGVIHRDLKPHNVIVDDEGRVRVTDFGIARAGASDMTQTGSIMGTAQYLSPEQAQGHAVSARSDLYSIGIILYELLTGALPFDGETAVTIALKQVSEQPAAPSALNPSVTPELDAVVLRALAKDPAARFADDAEMIAALEQARSGLQVDPGATAAFAAVPGPTPSPGLGDPLMLIPAAGLAGLAAGRGRGAGGAGGGVGAGGVGVGGAGRGPGAGSGLPPTGPLSVPADPDGAPASPSTARWWLLAAAIVVAAAAVVAAIVLLSPKHVTVPALARCTPASTAALALAGRGLHVQQVSRKSNACVQGDALGEAPAAGTSVRKGSTVTLTVAAGPVTATVPSVVDDARTTALDKLTDAGFKPVAQTAASSTIALGHVISTSPVGGATEPVGTQVVVTVSRGPRLVTVPDVVGRPAAQAESALVRAGFQIGTLTTRPGNQAVGTVVAQSPLGGHVPAESPIDLVTAVAPKTVTVPDEVGMEEVPAAVALVSAGFSVSTRSLPATNPAQVNVVLAQTPDGNTRAKRGSTVVLTVGSPTTTTSATTSTPTTTSSTTTSTTTSTSTSTTSTTVPPAAAP